MQIILREDVPSLGKAGDLVKVSNGYARNYLIPRKIAVEATPKNLKSLEHQKLLIEHKKKRELKESGKLKDRIESISCTIGVKVGEDDKLYGSVTSMDIEEGLKREGVEIDRRKIELEEPIRTLGVYTVNIKIAPEIQAKLKVWVVKD
ncbi:MAG: 50S ribosomal protein L9 [Deltaproteobacteria bacterium]|nr:MAG: 50S ribosomal protein L9 [Deltaproteobacteria bacterium]